MLHLVFIFKCSKVRLKSSVDLIDLLQSNLSLLLRAELNRFDNINYLPIQQKKRQLTEAFFVVFKKKAIILHISSYIVRRLIG